MNKLTINVTGTVEIKNKIIIGKLIKMVRTNDSIKIVNDFSLSNKGVSKTKKSNEMAFDNGNMFYIDRNEAEEVKIKIGGVEQLNIEGSSNVKINGKHNFIDFEMSGSSKLNCKLRKDSIIKLSGSVTMATKAKKKVKNVLIDLKGTSELIINGKDFLMVEGDLSGESKLKVDTNVECKCFVNSGCTINNVKVDSTHIIQTYSCDGDNIGGDKIVYK